MCLDLGRVTNESAAATPHALIVPAAVSVCLSVCVWCRCCHSWCHEPVFTHWVYEWTTRLLVFVRQLLLTFAPHPL